MAREEFQIIVVIALHHIKMPIQVVAKADSYF
jgi:hypothetical protein